MYLDKQWLKIVGLACGRRQRHWCISTAIEPGRDHVTGNCHEYAFMQMHKAFNQLINNEDSQNFCFTSHWDTGKCPSCFAALVWHLSPLQHHLLGSLSLWVAALSVARGWNFPTQASLWFLLFIFALDLLLVAQFLHLLTLMHVKLIFTQKHLTSLKRSDSERLTLKVFWAWITCRLLKVSRSDFLIKAQD